MPRGEVELGEGRGVGDEVEDAVEVARVSEALEALLVLFTDAAATSSWSSIAAAPARDEEQETKRRGMRRGGDGRGPTCRCGCFALFYMGGCWARNQLQECLHTRLNIRPEHVASYLSVAIRVVA